jgi:hypothetical protein
VTPRRAAAWLREWTRRIRGALTGRRSDRDLQRELDGHLALAADDLRRQGHTPDDAARLARAAAGGRVQALEALRDQRGIPWLGSSWLDVKLGLRLLARNWGLTVAGGLAMTVAIAPRAGDRSSRGLKSPRRPHLGRRMLMVSPISMTVRSVPISTRPS